MQKKRLSNIKVIITLILLLLCRNAINADNLCDHKRAIASPEGKLFVGCDNGLLRSLTLLGERDWIFIVEIMKTIDDGTPDIILSEAYRIDYGMTTPSLPPHNGLLDLDTVFFQKGRSVFLRIHTTPRDTILPLKAPNYWKFQYVRKSY